MIWTVPYEANLAVLLFDGAAALRHSLCAGICHLHIILPLNEKDTHRTRTHVFQMITLHAARWVFIGV